MHQPKLPRRARLANKVFIISANDIIRIQTTPTPFIGTDGNLTIPDFAGLRAGFFCACTYWTLSAIDIGRNDTF
jgi:hypothetical protein